ncbi:hypothetical protein GQ55_5G499200 [Panicum hallii var. hallii]|uniref:Uncharacterized protein n=1 Tax=Panicum hallii var. hallii TaxID=1504633 RepID=A0A2T7DRW5_9POAL|nr:hypothetical protein GQ55_5G499200 [Panicum hallii var. hallii]
MGDGNSPPGSAASRPTPSEEDYGSWTWNRNIMPKHPDSASYFKEKLQDMFGKYLRTVCPKPRPVFEKDSVKQFYQILSTMASYNALRCARVALKGAAPLRGRRADPNGRHRYGFTPLHLAAENFSVDMVKLLFRHGASANVRTKGEDVVEGLLPLHVAVENAAQKMFLDTTRLIAKQTDSIVDEVWNYIRTEKLVEAAILLLAAQKQLRGCRNKSSSQVSLNGLDIVKSNIDEALDTLHLEGLAMVKEGKNGKALQMLQNKKEALLTAHALVGIIQKAGEALEGYIQTYPEVSHEEIVEHVSSILTRDCEKTNEADKASSLEDEVSKRILIKHPPKGLAIKEVRNMFFPYWKSVLSCRFMVKIAPACKPSRKDLPSAEASKKGTKKSMGNPGSMVRPQLASNYEPRRMLCAVASMSRKVLFKRT